MTVKYNDFKTLLKGREASYLEASKRVFESGWFILGEEVKSFEKEFAEFLGVKYCIGVANGMEALQISLMALGIGKGDEVITTPISAVASTLAILNVGATPVFVDVDKSGQINVDLIEGAVTEKTKAILPVHLYGNPCNLGKIQDICSKHNFKLIEDAAQAHGAKFGSKMVGTIGDIGCFSFYPTKNLFAIGDGGAIVTDDEKLAEFCRMARDYGQESKYKHTIVGLNSRLDELQAALLKINLEHLPSENETRRKAAGKYISLLKDVKTIDLVANDPGLASSFHIFAIRSKRRDELKEYLKAQGIETLIHYPITIPDQPILKEFESVNIPEARAFVNETLSLPCHPLITDEEIEYVCKKIAEFLES